MPPRKCRNMEMPGCRTGPFNLAINSVAFGHRSHLSSDTDVKPRLNMTSPPVGAELEKQKVANDANPVGSDLKGDWLNFFLLILLYIMQGIPLGLAAAVPILLQSNKNVSYKDQVNGSDETSTLSRTSTDSNKNNDQKLNNNLFIPSEYFVYNFDREIDDKIGKNTQFNIFLSILQKKIYLLQ